VPWKDKYPAAQLVPFDAGWADRYACVAAELTAALGPQWDIEHVGSTSVPGLLAKPVVDVALRLPEGRHLSEWHGVLTEAGWTTPIAVGDHWGTFLLSGSVRAAIGHVFTADDWPTAHVRLFADWLRTHERDRDRYANLKSSLVDQGIWGSEYTAAKGGLVREIVNCARASRGLPPVGPL